MIRLLKNNNFIERSIMGALSFFKNSIFAQDIAEQKGFLQTQDPRVKAFCLLLFVILTLIVRNIPILLCLYLFCISLALASKINILYFLGRTWVFIPLFSLFIALPAIFSNFTPGEPLTVFKVLGIKFIITRPGLLTAVLFVMRVITSVSFVILLSITTRHTELLKVLRIFKVPQIFVMIIGMCYRYIYLFLDIIEKSYLAIKSRTGGVIYYKKGQNIVTVRIATLWQRSLQLNEEVYNAMLSRGFNGEPYVLHEFKASVKDRIWLIFTAIIFIFVIALNSKLNP